MLELLSLFFWAAFLKTQNKVKKTAEWRGRAETCRVEQVCRGWGWGPAASREEWLLAEGMGQASMALSVDDKQFTVLHAGKCNCKQTATYWCNWALCWGTGVNQRGQQTIQFEGVDNPVEDCNLTPNQKVIFNMGMSFYPWNLKIWITAAVSTLIKTAVFCWNLQCLQIHTQFLHFPACH